MVCIKKVKGLKKKFLATDKPTLVTHSIHQYDSSLIHKYYIIIHDLILVPLSLPPPTHTHTEAEDYVIILYNCDWNAVNLL